MKITTDLKTNIEIAKKRLGIGVSFDVIGKELVLDGVSAYLILIDGFAKDQIMYFITKELHSLKKSELRKQDTDKFILTSMSYMETEDSNDLDYMEEMLLSGAVILMIDGYDKAIIIDAREYPVRSPAEPDLERVTRGPRDGFVETIVFNTALIRRRIKDKNLRFSLSSVGELSKTNVAVAYIEGLADEGYVQEIKDKIEAAKPQSLVMAEKSLADLIIPKKWYNPLPQTRFTERPDVAAAHLLEGHVLVLVDTTPSVMIFPTTLFHFTQHAEDYYQNPLVGTYMRWVRFGAMFLSYMLAPLWLLLVLNIAYLPEALSWIGPEEDSIIPLIIQLLIIELGLDVLRISSLHTPSSLTTSLGIIGGLILGEFAVKVGWFVPEAVLYMAVTGICTFAIPSIELAFAIRIFRLFLLLCTGLLSIYGFIVANAVVLFIVCTTKNISRKSWLWPLLPFDADALKHILFRSPTPRQ